MSSVSSGRKERSTAVPAPEESLDVLRDHSSASSLLKTNQVLALRSPCPVSSSKATTTDMSGSGHLVVDVRPTSAEDGDGSKRPDEDGLIIGAPGGGVQFTLAFVDLTYSIKQPRSLLRRSRHEEIRTGARARTVLDGVSGEARDGEILAVVGASGAGKTTLIDALAGRIQRGSLRGAVTLNGEALGGRRLKAISAYVMQDDLLYPTLTVTETLMYSAEFRFPRSVPASKKRGRVEALIDQLGLRGAADTIIGEEGRRGVSGGERRRVSIGVDIIHDPVILFLDEPTSGLDSTSAFMVVKVLKRVAQSGSVVIMSIHQPGHRILGFLDRLQFLSRGRTVYYGPPAGLHPFFLEIGHPIPDGENPAEFALDTIHELESAPGDGTKELVELSRSWQQKPLPRAVSARSKRPVHERLLDEDGSSTAAANTNAAGYANPWWVEVWVLTRRAFTNKRRKPELSLIRLCSVTVTALALATVFWRLDDTPVGVNERVAFFIVAMSAMFYGSADALPVFLAERYIVIRETTHNAYRLSSYTLSNVIVALPLLLLMSVAFSAITFFSVGLTSGFVFFVLVVLASYWAGTGFATFVSAVIPHVVMGCAVAMAALAYYLLYSGYFITRDRMPSYWVWFHYLSLIKYPYQAVVQNEFGGEPGRCFMRGVQMFDGTPIGRFPEATKVDVLNAMIRALRVDFNSSSCIMAEPDILAKQAVTDLGKWACLWITVAWGFLFRVLFYVTLLLVGKNKRS